MSIRAMAAVEELPGDLFVCGERFVLYMLANAANDRDLTQPTVVEVTWLVDKTSQSDVTVRRHLASLSAEDGWIQRETTRRADGGQGPYAFRLCLEKLGLAPTPSSNWGGGVQAVENRAPPAQIEEAPVPKLESPPSSDRGGPPPQIDRSSKEGLPTLLSKYAWMKPDHETAALRILSVAGPRLADPMKDIRVLADLSEVLESWLASFDLEADIAPVVSQQTTGRGRKPGSLVNLSVLTEDLWKWRMARKKREAVAPAPSAEVEMKRDAKLARNLGLTIKEFDNGARPEWMLDLDDRQLDGDAREAAFLRKRDELVRRRDALLGAKEPA